MVVVEQLGKGVVTSWGCVRGKHREGNEEEGKGGEGGMGQEIGTHKWKIKRKMLEKKYD